MSEASQVAPHRWVVATMRDLLVRADRVRIIPRSSCYQRLSIRSVRLPIDPGRPGIDDRR